jgi:hypothetical protein
MGKTSIEYFSSDSTIGLRLYSKDIGFDLMVDLTDLPVTGLVRRRDACLSSKPTGILESKPKNLYYSFP